MEPRPGFEPGTPALPGQCSNQAELPGRPTWLGVGWYLSLCPRGARQGEPG